MKYLLNILIISVWTLALTAQETAQSDVIEELIQQQEFSKARDILMRQYVANDEDPETNYWLAVLALRDTLYDDAIDYLDVAIEGDENNAQYYYMLGSAYAVKTQNAGAIKAAFSASSIKSNWQKALEIDPDHLQARWGLFQFFLNAPGILGGDQDEAKKLAENHVVKDPGEGHMMLARYYWFSEENIEKTEDELTQSLDAETDEDSYKRIRYMGTDLLNRLGYRFLNKKDYDKSEKYFKWAIKVTPEYQNPYDSMGDYFAAVAKYDSALVYYEKAVSIKPDFTVSLFNKAETLYNLGKKDESLVFFRQLIDKFPGDRYAKKAKDRLAEIGEEGDK